jgi:pantoate--beta-alanine ligase
MAQRAGVDVVFTPVASDLYPADASTWVNVEGLSEVLCGASRPGHFRGVTTVVTKLFNLVQPDIALFGNKDFQQLAVIRRMVRDLAMPVEIIGLPIIREEDGLALSSRNVYLSSGERQQALVLSRALATARQLAAGGEDEVQAILEVVQALISGMPAARIDYAQICQQETLKEQERIDGNSVLLLAVFIGKTRLIDNSFML